MPDTATELLDRPAEETAEVRADETAGAAGAAAETADVIAEVRGDEAAGAAADVIAADLLVEEISIDGMCGVY